MEYAPIRQRTRKAIGAALSSGNPSEIHDALLSAAYWDSDWRWAQQQLLSFAGADDIDILWAVVLGLGFVAAFHGELDEEVVRPILARLKVKPTLAGAVQETEEEIDHFVTRRRAGEKISLGRRLPENWRPSGE